MSNDPSLASRRLKVARPANFAERLSETLAALETLTSVIDRPLGAADLLPFYPSPAALQLYLLNDSQVLGVAVEYRNSPRASAEGLRAMLHGLENASVWVGDVLNDSRDPKFGMRSKYPRIRELVTYFAVFELDAVRQNHELTNARMLAVFNVWEGTARDSDARRTLVRWHNTLTAWRKTYKSAITNQLPRTTIDRHKLEARNMIAGFRSQVHVKLFLIALTSVSSGPLTPPSSPRRTIDMGETRSEELSRTVAPQPRRVPPFVKIEPEDVGRLPPPPPESPPSDVETGTGGDPFGGAMFGSGQ